MAPEPRPPRGRIAFSLVAAIGVMLGLAFGVRSLVRSLGRSPPAPSIVAVTEPSAPPGTTQRTRPEPPTRERTGSATSRTREPPAAPSPPEAPTEAPASPDADTLESTNQWTSLALPFSVGGAE